MGGEVDFDLWVKLSSLLLAIVGGVFLSNFQRWKGKGAQGELVEKLDLALKVGTPHAVAHLFFLLHGLKLACADIRILIERDDSSIVIDTLKRRRGSLGIKNGRFYFSDWNRNPTVRRWIVRFSQVYMFLISMLIMLTVPLILSIDMGSESAALIVLLFFLTGALISQYRDYLVAARAERLVVNSGFAPERAE